MTAIVNYNYGMFMSIGERQPPKTIHELFKELLFTSIIHILIQIIHEWMASSSSLISTLQWFYRHLLVRLMVKLIFSGSIKVFGLQNERLYDNIQYYH